MLPAWGLTHQGGAGEYAESAPWVQIFPGIAITLAVFGFSLFADAVRDTLDPKLRPQRACARAGPRPPLPDQLATSSYQSSCVSSRIK